jgi:hypothetical protein
MAQARPTIPVSLEHQIQSELRGEAQGASHAQALFGHASAPLTVEHLRLINQNLRKLSDLQGVLDKIAATGADVSGYQAQAQQLHGIYTAIKQQFFSHIHEQPQ